MHSSHRKKAHGCLCLEQSANDCASHVDVLDVKQQRRSSIFDIVVSETGASRQDLREKFSDAFHTNPLHTLMALAKDLL